MRVFGDGDGVLLMGTDECRNAQQNARVKDFAQGVESRTFPDPQFPEFLLVCDR